MSSAASICHTGFIFRSTSKVMGLSDLFFSKSVTSAQMPASIVRRRRIAFTSKSSARSSQLVLRHPALDCTHDHVMLLDGRESGGGSAPENAPLTSGQQDIVGSGALVKILGHQYGSRLGCGLQLREVE